VRRVTIVSEANLMASVREKEQCGRAIRRRQRNYGVGVFGECMDDWSRCAVISRAEELNT